MLLLGIQSIYSKTNDAVLKDLQSHSPALQQQLSQYTSISGNYETKFYFELYPTPLFGGLSDRVVRDYPLHLVFSILTCRRSLFQNILLLFQELSMLNQLLSTKIM